MRKEASCRSGAHSRAGFGSGNAGPLPGHDHPERPRLDGAPDGCGQQDGLAVDADGDLGGVGADGDLIGGEGGQSRAVPAAEEPDRLPGAIHPDRDHAQGAGIQPSAAAQAGDVAHLVQAVADQQGLRALDRGAAGLGGQPGPMVAAEQVGQHLQGGAPLVVPVGGLRTTSA